MEQELLLEKPMQMDSAEILNEEERMFKSWATVEIKDVDGELLPMKEFKKIMPIMLDRGGVLMDSHSNRHVGKIINYEFKEHPESGEEGVYVTCKVFKDYNFDDMVWEGVKKGFYTGLSFGGIGNNKSFSYEKGMDVTKVLGGIEGFEFSLVQSPANKGALIKEVNYLAKSEKEKREIKLQVSKFDAINKKLNFIYEVKKHEKKGMSHRQAVCEVLKINLGIANKYLNKNSLSNIIMETKVAKEEMPGQQPAAQPAAPQENSVESRIAKLEEAVAKIIEMLSNSQPVAQSAPAAPVAKESAEKVTLPKTEAEKVQEKEPATGAKDDSVQLVQKEISDIKKSLNEFKSLLEANKASTPKPVDDKYINKSEDKVARPKNFADAHKIARGLN